MPAAVKSLISRWREWRYVMIGRIFPNGVFAAFPQQLATLLTQMKQEIPPFHAATASSVT